MIAALPEASVCEATGSDRCEAPNCKQPASFIVGWWIGTTALRLVHAHLCDDCVAKKQARDEEIRASFKRAERKWRDGLRPSFDAAWIATTPAAAMTDTD